jgi:hypothetical protein
MSPHEMTSARIEELITGLEQDIANPNYAGDRWASTRRQWEGRREQYVKLLKERADAGTYNTAGGVDQETPAYR